MINLGIVGACGRMGVAIAQLALKDESLALTKLFEHEKHKQMGNCLTQDSIKLEIINENNTKELAGIIDFSTPSSSLHSAEICSQNNLALVIGTTGWSASERQEIESYADKIPLLIATNMSLGVNMLFALTEMASKLLKDKGFDPEIVETHHKLKKDAPSGTATTLKEIILEQFHWNENNVNYGRQGFIGARPEKELGVMALRGGDIVGEHSVNFFGEGEKLVLSHTATSRNTFASGALIALKFLVEQKPGLYDMRDVLGLK